MLEWPRRLSRSGSIGAELIVAVGVVLEVVLVSGFGLPERARLADLGRDLGAPKARGVGDRVLGDLALLVAGIEDLGAVVGADQLFAKVGPVDLEEELQDVPVGGPPGIEDDLDRLGVTCMVAGGRVVVLAAGVPDPGGDDPVAVAQQFLREPETAPREDRGLGVLAHRGPSPRNCVKTTSESPAGPAARGGRWEPSWEPS